MLNYIKRFTFLAFYSLWVYIGITWRGLTTFRNQQLSYSDSNKAIITIGLLACIVFLLEVFGLFFIPDNKALTISNLLFYLFSFQYIKTRIHMLVTRWDYYKKHTESVFMHLTYFILVIVLLGYLLVDMYFDLTVTYSNPIVAITHVVASFILINHVEDNKVFLSTLPSETED